MLLYGPLKYSFFFWLFLSVAMSLHGITDLQLENLLLEFETNYDLLLKETQVLRMSFNEQRNELTSLQSCNEELQQSLTTLDHNLKHQQTISQGLKDSLEYQMNLSEELTVSLNEAENLSKKAENSYKKRIFRAYLIGGGVGLVVGAIVTGVIIGLAK